MNKDRQLEPSFLDRLTDGFTAVSEGIVGFLGRLFGSSNDRMVRSLGFVRHRDGAYHITPGSVLDVVNGLEAQMQALSDEDLKGLSVKFKERLAKGETLDDILPEAFAACREAGRRTKNMRHFDVQILGGVVLHRGNIAEMVTGEGKTLVATLPAYLNALTGKGVHVVTVNDYLARRDCEWMSPIYLALGVSCGYIQSDMEPGPRRAAYEKDITYGTNSEFGFDYLRDNMKRARHADPNYDAWEQQVQRGLHFAIIDEVDNILIDEARTPLIISGPAQDDPDLYRKADRIARQLTELERKAQAKLKEAGHGLNIPDHPLTKEQAEAEEAIQESKKRKVSEAEAKEAVAIAAAAESEIDVQKVLSKAKENEKRLGYYFEIKEKEHTCHLTDEGVRKAEELAGVDSFYTAGNMEWPHLIDNALKAHHLYHKDKRYVVMRHPETKEISVILVDEFTGRLMVGRQLSDGLHQALEAKHERDGVKIKEETQTLATVTLQNFFKLYKKLAGMTGTAMTEANEFWKIYKLDVVAIPTNRPLTRINYPDLIYLTEKEKWDAVVGEIERINKYDTLFLNDSTVVIGTIAKESETEVEIDVKETRERKTFPVGQIREIERKGRPILIGTTDVDKSEKLSRMLARRGVKHELLNAKPEYASREAEIVAQAGRIGAVTISTNMAGRGTDIILGGNPEFMAWARLKDQYATLLDVPPDLWKQTVAEMREKENMVEEGKVVIEMGGLHIIGTERHESRRIDNQLRGRAGRQGDPGTGRFFLSLQDDLMRIFAGEWVAGVLQRLGMEEGQAIESRMVTRRIEGAQKKVEERNFDIRKNLLEYDEVMDHQRKRVYGFRQEILDGANCKLRILEMIDKQIHAAVDRFLDPNYGAASFAELASTRLNTELEAPAFARAAFKDAEATAREKAAAMVQTRVLELMDEHVAADAEPSDWNWNGLSERVNQIWDLKTKPDQLRKIGRDDLAQHLIAEAEKSIQAVDLSKGEIYLSENWGLQSLADWMRQKFDVTVDPAAFVEQPKEKVRAALHGEIAKLYRNKEIEFPISVAMARFMAEQRSAGPMGARYDRDGLLRWFKARFPSEATGISEDDFRTLSRARIQELLLEVSRKHFPQGDQETIDAKIDESLHGATYAEPADAQELSEWVRAQFGLEVPAEELVRVSKETARNTLWNAFDAKFRPEMRRVERGLLLDRLDRAWKNHLYVMDHLRQGIGLVGYAQIDPKTEFKRQGMKEFDGMWDGLADKVTESVFRLEDDESFQESIWSISHMVHEAAPRPTAPPPGSMQAEQQDAIAGSQQSEKKVEPIRNRGEKVGRNDPCTCGSGKKYKNCCMRSAAK